MMQENLCQRMKKRIIKILVLSLFIGVGVGIYAKSRHIDGYDWRTKIGTEVLELMSVDPQQEIPVYVFLENYKDEELEKALKKSGFDEKKYTNTRKFNEELVSEITEEVIENVGIDVVYKDDSKLTGSKYDKVVVTNKQNLRWKSLDEAPELIKEAVNENIKEYKNERIQCVQKLCKNYNQEFIDSCDIEENDIIYKGELVRTIIVEATAKEIRDYAQKEEVESIGFYEKEEEIPLTNVVLSQIGADSVTGSKTEYTGNGVKIGVIEAAVGRYNKKNMHLNDIPNLNYVEFANGPEGTVNSHATLVTSIICGKECAVDGAIYGGIAPDATVYQTPVVYRDDVYNAIEKFALMGVDIINYSGGSRNYNGLYTDYDKMVDSLIYNSNIIYVNAAGNDGEEIQPGVISPGLALNAITVGNVYTRDYYNGNTYNEPFSTAYDSSYEEMWYLPNKPDIVAPGCLFVINDEGKVDSAYGTSVSAPVVTSVIAQMLEANPELKANPTLVKSKLLLAADDSRIKTSGDALVGNCLWEKSGAGMIDAQASIAAAKSNNHKTITYVNDLTQLITCGHYMTGQTIRAVMVMSKPEYKDIVDRMDLEDANLVLLDSSGNVVAESASGINYVEIIECTIEADDTYTLQVEPCSTIAVDAIPEISVSWTVN